MPICNDVRVNELGVFEKRCGLEPRKVCVSLNEQQ